MSDFAVRTRAALKANGISMRQAARRLNYDVAYLSRVLNGKQNPSEQLAEGLDGLVGAEGALAALATTLTPDHRSRIARSVAQPSRIDSGTVIALADVLAAQRHLDDALGSAAVLPATKAQLDTVTGLVHGARGPHRDALVDVAAQWGVFGGWLATAVGQCAKAGSWFDRAVEWSAEADNATMTAIVWSFKGYLAGQEGHDAATVGLAKAARRVPRVHPAQSAYSAFQTARGYAVLGQDDKARRLLGDTSRLIARASEAGEPPGAIYWNREPFFRLHIGRTYLLLGDYADAAEHLVAGLAGLPPDMRDAEWTGKYWGALEQAKGAV